ncbi:hypothetical protein H1R20_g9834, partial [Candolleomyces eurysporus]
MAPNRQDGPININASEHLCHRCSNALLIKGPAQEGAHPGQYYLHCNAYAGWHYVFPKGIAPLAYMANPPPVPFLAVPPTPLGASNGPPAKPKIHCIIAGSCSMKGHTERALTGKQKGKLGNQPPNLLPVLQQMEHRIRELHEDSRLTLFKVPSTSNNSSPWIPQLSDDAEALLQWGRDNGDSDAESFDEHMLTLGLEASRQEARITREGDSLRVGTSSSSGSLLSVTPLSTSQPGSQLPSVQALFAAVDLQASSPAMTSQAPPPKPTAKPTITRQLDTLWHQDWSKLAEEQGDRAQQPKSLCQAEKVQNFTVVYWDSHDCEPTIVEVSTSEYRDWPIFRIEDSPLVDGIVESEAVQYYSYTNEHWTTIPRNHPIQVRVNAFVLLRRPNVKRLKDFEHYLSRGRKEAPTSSIMHQRQNMPGECQGTLTKLKASKISQEPTVSPDSSPARTPKRRRTRRTSTAEFTFTALPNPPVLTVWPSPPPLSNSPLLSPTILPSSSSTVVASVSSCSVETIEFSSDSEAEIDIPEHAQLPCMVRTSAAWPNGLYAIEMDMFFIKINELKQQKVRPFAKRFQRVFGEDAPPESTYYDQLGRWKNASAEDREEARGFGYIEEGLWQNFVKDHPIRG